MTPPAPTRADDPTARSAASVSLPDTPTSHAADRATQSAVTASLRCLWHALRWQVLGVVPITVLIAVVMARVTIVVEELVVSTTSVVGFVLMAFAIGLASEAAPLLQLSVAQGIARRATLAAGGILFTGLALASGTATGLVAWWEQSTSSAMDESNVFGTFVSAAGEPLVVGVQTVVVVLIVTLIVWLMALVGRHFGAVWTVVVGIVTITLSGVMLGSVLNTTDPLHLRALVAIVAPVVVLGWAVASLARRAPVDAASPWTNSITS